MKFLFVHDHKFYYSKDNQFYSDGKFPYQVWERYLAVCDHIVVAARTRSLQNSIEAEKLNLSSGENVSFIQLPSISGIVNMLKYRQKVHHELSLAVQDADALIVRIPSELGYLAIKIAKKFHKPYAVEVVGHAWGSLWSHGSWIGKLYAPIATFRMKKLVKEAPYAMYVTKKFLQQKYPCLGVTASASNVELPQVKSDVLKKRLEKIDANELPIKIGLIGTLSTQYKGIDTAFYALSIIKKHIPPFEFHILGGGETEYWENKAKSADIKEKVFFDGVLPNGDPVFSWLDNMDLYIQPSRMEGLPRALVEAMSRGLPSIGSDIAGISELLSKECLHLPNDDKMLARLILKAVEDLQWRKTQAIRNHETSKAYSKTNLAKIRNCFWSKFAKSVEIHKHNL